MARSIWPTSLLVVVLDLLYARVSAEASATLDSDYHKFITRPDIVAPRWNIKVFEKDSVSPGYWFVAPYEHIGQDEPGGGWVGPHIYDSNGELIWSGTPMFGYRNTFDFTVSKVNGEDMLTVIAPPQNAAVVLDRHYEEHAKVDMGTNQVSLNMHDFNVVDNGTRAVALRKILTKASDEMSEAVGYTEGDCKAIFHGIQEFEIEDNATNWEPGFFWSEEDHIGLNESTMVDGTVEGRCRHWWDYSHANAVDKFPDGDYLFSTRHTDSIYKISRKDGSIVWRLGGVGSDFKSDFEFSRQHNARVHEQNATHTILSFLDNAKGEDGQEPTSDRSRGVLVALRTDKRRHMTATLLAHYDHPSGPGNYASGRGNYQALSNGNVHMCWSDELHHSEHTADGKMVLEAQVIPSGLRTYRSYKFPFVGEPNQPPDVYSSASSADVNTTITVVYASWNGATEVAHWHLYKTDEQGEMGEKVAEMPRLGFETVLSYDGYASYVIAEAVDKNDNVLGQSKVVKTIPSSDLPNTATAAEASWLEQEFGGGQTTWVSDATDILFNPIVTFVFGFIGGAVLLLLIWTVRRKGFTWRRQTTSYEPLAARDKDEEHATEERHFSDNEAGTPLTARDKDDEHAMQERRLLDNEAGTS